MTQITWSDKVQSTKKQSQRQTSMWMIHNPAVVKVHLHFAKANVEANYFLCRCPAWILKAHSQWWMKVEAKASFLWCLSFITTTKRSLEQGKIFRSVCHSFRGEGGLLPGGGGSASRGSWADHPGIRKADGTHPTGMLSCLLISFACSLIFFTFAPTFDWWE